ncbi:MAG TPA: hypothetical protein VFP34_15055 [Microlunatus sp.]|nr:hypothetical protein [Microlunatus sp.]
MSELTLSPARVMTGRVRRAGWDRLSHGLHVVRDRTLTDELRAWSQVLPPHTAFTHLTAAEYRGWWLPAAIPHPVFAAGTVTDQHRRPGLYVCRHPEPGPHQFLDGLRITTAAETLLACARDLGVLDLVIMADSALRLGHCTLTELKLAARPRRRGAPLLRSILPLLDPRSESPWESTMRVLHRAAGIPVSPQHEVYDATGRLLARADLWVVGTRRLHEYDGAVHRLGEVHGNDLRRDRRLSRAGWTRYGFTSTDVLTGGGAIVAECDRLLGRPPDPGRVRAWNDLVETSLYGRQGRARAYRRWSRWQSESAHREIRAGTTTSPGPLSPGPLSPGHSPWTKPPDQTPEGAIEVSRRITP